MERLRLTIEGMSCGHCVRAVTKALEGIEGLKIQGVEVGSATVEHDPASVPPEEVASAVEQAGFAVAGMQKGAD
jgi:copper chaperone